MAKDGDLALEGKEEPLVYHVFEPVDENRLIEGSGTEIMIFDPSAPVPAYWTHTDVDKNGKKDVSAGYKVRVIVGGVKFTKSG
ncbi:hypothetical protein IFR05_012567 [Cadophora sp. M221]|nr:hypothetical protein IFR05_012567 [Cadophora sp. M221]